MKTDKEMQDEIIDYIINEPEFKNICESFGKANNIADELYQEFILYVLEYPNIQKYYEIFQRDQFLYYGCNMIKLSAVSNNHTFYRKIRRFGILSSEISTDVIDKPKNTRAISDLLFILKENFIRINKWFDKKEKEDKVWWYHRTLFEKYIYEDMTYRQIEKETKINHASIYNSIKQTIKLIGEEVIIDSIYV